MHFGLVVTAAAIACFASLALSIAGARARDGRAMLMGTAFSTMTALFTVHALATPTIFNAGFNGMMPLAGGLSVPVGAVLLALTALPALRRPALRAPARGAAGDAVRRRAARSGVYGLLNPTVLPGRAEGQVAAPRSACCSSARSSSAC